MLFPTVKAENLEGRALTLPEDLEGAYNALFIAFQRGQQIDIDSWIPLVKQLVKAIGCSEDRGWEIAWEVHNTGKSVVKVGPETECVRVGNILAAIGLVVTVTQS